MPEWTTKQLAAIQARNRSILVSAAAGSGKTAVLIERIMAMLREGKEIDRMLVVTFTRAAATEMRERLLKTLLPEAMQSKALKVQRDRLGSADISTLHQFCIKLIRRHFQAVGADPQSKVGDDGLLKSLLERALQDEMEAMYESPDEDSLCLIDQYSDMQIEDLFYRLHTFLMSQEKPWQWLTEQAQKSLPDDLSQTSWYKILKEESLAQAESAVALASACIEIASLPGGPARYLPAAQSDLQMALAVQESLLAYDSLPPEWKAQFVRLSTARAGEDESDELKEQFKALRDAAKASLERAINSLPRGGEALQKAKEDITFTQPALRALAVLTQRTHEHYGELKRAKQLLDYADLEHLALACLSDPAVTFQVHQKYEAIFVDEYQDISRIQEAIIKGLHGANCSLFMVGDVKQSIYRFRLADPMLFLDKYSAFDAAPDAAQRVITLSENFRSRDNILLSVNHVFDHALQGGALEIDYDSEAALYPGSHSFEDPACELHLILPKDGDEEDEGEQLGGSEREALLIAQRIAALRGSIIQGRDGPKSLSFRDMVILLRSASGRAEKIAGVLRENGIPVYSDADSQFFDLIEVTDFLNLLHVLDNPFDDERLMSVLSAPPFQFGPDDLIRIRNFGDKTQPFFKSFFDMEESDPAVADVIRQLALWRMLAENLPLEGFVRRLLRETGIYARAGAKPQGELRRANLRLLCERSAPNPEPQTLHGFLSRVTQARKQDNTRAAATLGAGEDVVRIMTIHKSKGLEFPVVFLPDLAHRFRLGSQGDLLLMDAQDGLALKLVDQEQRLTYHTLAGKAIQMKKDRQIRSEEARLLYVAMTRTKERLIMLSAPSSLAKEQKRWAMAGSGAGPANAANMLE
ncbi:MAG: UvrD-helicase domain-containing protein, partial [Clostridiales bacterium]|nr:UvrD-helicase domain-containing protein [Clostridiales bacterium]